MLSGKGILIVLGFISVLVHVSRAESSKNGILYDLYPFVRVYRNGTVERLIGKDSVPAGLDLETGVDSKDVIFSRSLNLTARLYLPEKATGAKKLPILIYYHGGGFFVESASSPTYHRYLNTLVAKARVLAVSVNYRLAPEHPLPAAFDDSWFALKWTVSHVRGGAGKDPWLRNYADFGKIYLGGDSAGANIVQNMAVRIGTKKPISSSAVAFQGMYLNCPFFAGTTTAPWVAPLWNHAYPHSKNGLDNPLMNPGRDPHLKLTGILSAVVFVGGDDPLKVAGVEYSKKIVASGWKGQMLLVEYPGEGHVFNLNHPNSTDAINMLNITTSFINPSS